MKTALALGDMTQPSLTPEASREEEPGARGCSGRGETNLSSSMKGSCPITDQLTHDTESDARRKTHVAGEEAALSLGGGGFRGTERLTECPRSGRACGLPRCARAQAPERQRRAGTASSSQARLRFQSRSATLLLVARA